MRLRLTTKSQLIHCVRELQVKVLFYDLCANMLFGSCPVGGSEASTIWVFNRNMKKKKKPNIQEKQMFLDCLKWEYNV